MKNLKTTTAFIIAFSKTNHTSDEFENIVTDYAHFMDEEMTKEMFINEDEDQPTALFKGFTFSHEYNDFWMFYHNGKLQYVKRNAPVQYLLDHDIEAEFTELGMKKFQN